MNAYACGHRERDVRLTLTMDIDIVVTKKCPKSAERTNHSFRHGIVFLLYLCMVYKYMNHKNQNAK